MPAQEPVFSSPSISLTSSNTIGALPLSHRPPPFLQIQAQVTGRKPGIPLDTVQPGSALCANPSNSFAPSKNWSLLFTLQSFSTIQVQSHHNHSLHFLCPYNTHLTNMPQRNALVRSVCLYRPRSVSGRGRQSLSTRIPCTL